MEHWSKKKSLSKNEKFRLRDTIKKIEKLSNKSKMICEKRDRRLGVMKGGGGLVTLIRKDAFEIKKLLKALSTK